MPTMTRPVPTMQLPILVVSLGPSRSTMSPEAEIEIKDATVMHISNRPMPPGVRSRPSRIAGSRDTQVAKATPLAA